MEGNSFILPDRDRVPSAFAAMCLVFAATAGRYVSPYIAKGLEYFLTLLSYNMNEAARQAADYCVYYLFFMMVPFSVCARVNPGLGENIRVKPLPGRVYPVIIGAAVTGVFFADYITFFIALLTETLGGTPTGSDIIIPGGVSGILGSLITIAVLPGVCEELLFRGVLLSSLEDRGALRAAVISALWFTLAHTSLIAAPSEWISGFVMGIITISTGSLFAGILYHVSFNGVIVLLEVAAQNAANEETAAFTMYEQAGGLSGCLICLGFLLVSGAVYFLLVRKILRAGDGKAFTRPVAGRRGADSCSIAVTVCCAAAVFFGYVIDLLEIMGVIG